MKYFSFRAKEYESALEAKTPVSDSPYKAKCVYLEFKVHFNTAEIQQVVGFRKQFTSNLFYVFRLQRLTKDLQKQLQTQDTGIWATNKVSALDRALGEVSRILEKQASI